MCCCEWVYVCVCDKSHRRAFATARSHVVQLFCIAAIEHGNFLLAKSNRDEQRNRLSIIAYTYIGIVIMITHESAICSFNSPELCIHRNIYLVHKRPNSIFISSIFNFAMCRCDCNECKTKKFNRQNCQQANYSPALLRQRDQRQRNTQMKWKSESFVAVATQAIRIKFDVRLSCKRNIRSLSFSQWIG